MKKSDIIVIDHRDRKVTQYNSDAFVVDSDNISKYIPTLSVGVVIGRLKFADKSLSGAGYEVYGHKIEYKYLNTTDKFTSDSIEAMDLSYKDFEKVSCRVVKIKDKFPFVSIDNVYRYVPKKRLLICNTRKTVLIYIPSNYIVEKFLRNYDEEELDS